MFQDLVLEYIGSLARAVLVLAAVCIALVVLKMVHG